MSDDKSTQKLAAFGLFCLIVISGVFLWNFIQSDYFIWIFGIAIVAFILHVINVIKNNEL